MCLVGLAAFADLMKSITSVDAQVSLRYREPERPLAASIPLSSRFVVSSAVIGWADDQVLEVIERRDVPIDLSCKGVIRGTDPAAHTS